MTKFNGRIGEIYHSRESGKIGYAILWLLGVPLPLLVIWYLIFN